MYVITAYDISTDSLAGQRRLQRVAKACENYGIRVQDSVFECDLEPADFAELKATLEQLIDHETDRITFYHLGRNWRRRIERLGISPRQSFSDDFVV